MWLRRVSIEDNLRKLNPELDITESDADWLQITSDIKISLPPLFFENIISKIGEIIRL